MAYIGNTVNNQSYVPAIDYFSGNGSTVAFTLSRPVASVAQVQAVIENVPQNPGDAYTVSGNTITFTSAPPSGTNNIYVYYTSPNTQVVQPGQGTVGTTQMADGVTINFNDGSAAAPSITNTGDTNTGIFFPAADTIAFSEGGVESMRIDASGNVGIGTSSPANKLTVVSTGDRPLLAQSGTDTPAVFKSTVSNSYIQIGNSTHDSYIGAVGANQAFTVNGAERMRITANGGVAFGGASNFGTSGQVLTSNGNAAPSWATPSGGFTQMQIYTSGSGAWTIPSGITACKITVVGGGGAGGNVNTSGLTQVTHCGGGGGGGASIRYYTSLTPGNTISYTVGAAGSTSSVSSGTQTITTISATGGSAGGSSAGASTNGGAGGSGSGGNINTVGGTGAFGNGGGGVGGASIFGGNGAGGGGASPNIDSGKAGVTYGAGGGGASRGGSTQAASGGAGFAGVVIIEF